MENINLLNFRSNGSKIFSGRDKGIDARKKLKLNELDSQEQKIEVIVPKDTWSINSSFFGGLFESSIINLKEDGFRKKYIFKFDDGAALSEELQHNIDEGIYESLKDI